MTLLTAPSSSSTPTVASPIVVGTAAASARGATKVYGIGDTEVTAKRFFEMSEEYGIDSELMERFRTDVA